MKASYKVVKEVSVSTKDVKKFIKKFVKKVKKFKNKSKKWLSL